MSYESRPEQNEQGDQFSDNNVGRIDFDSAFGISDEDFDPTDTPVEDSDIERGIDAPNIHNSTVVDVAEGTIDKPEVQEIFIPADDHRQETRPLEAPEEPTESTTTSPKEPTEDIASVTESQKEIPENTAEDYSNNTENVEEDQPSKGELEATTLPLPETAEENPSDELASDSNEELAAEEISEPHEGPKTNDVEEVIEPEIVGLETQGRSETPDIVDAEIDDAETIVDNKPDEIIIDAEAEIIEENPDPKDQPVLITEVGSMALNETREQPEKTEETQTVESEGFSGESRQEKIEDQPPETPSPVETKDQPETTSEISDIQEDVEEATEDEEDEEEAERQRQIMAEQISPLITDEIVKEANQEPPLYVDTEKIQDYQQSLYEVRRRALQEAPNEDPPSFFEKLWSGLKTASKEGSVMVGATLISPIGAFANRYKATGAAVSKTDVLGRPIQFKVNVVRVGSHRTTSIKVWAKDEKNAAKNATSLSNPYAIFNRARLFAKTS